MDSRGHRGGLEGIDRYYDPTTAQFTTLDPLVALTEEPYGYTAGNPANRSDPWGLDYHECPDGQFWSEGSGGCINGGQGGGTGSFTNPHQPWSANTYEACEPTSRPRDEITPSALDELANFLSPLPTDGNDIAKDLSPSSLSQWFAQNVFQELGAFRYPNFDAIAKRLGVWAIAYQVARLIYNLGEPDPIGEWDGTPVSPHLSPEGIPLPR